MSFTYEQRKYIEHCVGMHIMPTHIAEELGVSLPTLYEEFRLGAAPEHKPRTYYSDYSADRAEQRLRKQWERELTDDDREYIYSCIHREEGQDKQTLSGIYKALGITQSMLMAELARGGATRANNFTDYDPTHAVKLHSRRNRNITYRDRVKIEAGLKAGKRISVIAKEIGYNRATVYRELNRCGCKPPYLDYNADLAQRSK